MICCWRIKQRRSYYLACNYFINKCFLFNAFMICCWRSRQLRSYCRAWYEDDCE
ncbi:hypothetical protein T492DRAFT_955363 [Pavlovales sp. CCMP2436]|nr:hypothetical protein T492DRAFT_955363 [Pavlovales sp. CCMP2436]